MINNAKSLIEINKANVAALQNMTTQAFSGLQKMMELNLAAARAAVVESFGHSQSALGVKDAQQLLTLEAGQFQPWVMKYVSYRSQAYSIAAETGGEMVKAFTAIVENVEKNMPVAEPVVIVLKSAVNAGQIAIEKAQGTAKKAMEMAESTLENAVHMAENGNGNGDGNSNGSKSKRRA